MSSQKSCIDLAKNNSSGFVDSRTRQARAREVVINDNKLLGTMVFRQPAFYCLQPRHPPVLWGIPTLMQAVRNWVKARRPKQPIESLAIQVSQPTGRENDIWTVFTNYLDQSLFRLLREQFGPKIFRARRGKYMVAPVRRIEAEHVVEVQKN